MKAPILSLSAFAVHLVLGNLCMMQMAFAEESAVQTAHTHMEMVMTPVVPMSPADCQSCIVVELKQAPPFSVSCASGHCVSHTPAAASTAIPMIGIQEIASSRPIIAFLTPEVVFFQNASSTDPPSVTPPVKTIVLRL